MPLKIIAKHSHACLHRPLFWGDPHCGFNSSFPWRSSVRPHHGVNERGTILPWRHQHLPKGQLPRGAEAAPRPPHAISLCLPAPLCGLCQRGERSSNTLPAGAVADGQPLSRFPRHGGGRKGGGAARAPRRVRRPGREGGSERARGAPGGSGRLVRCRCSAAPLPGAAPGRVPPVPPAPYLKRRRRALLPLAPWPCHPTEHGPDVPAAPAEVPLPRHPLPHAAAAAAAAARCAHAGKCLRGPWGSGPAPALLPVAPARPTHRADLMQFILGQDKPVWNCPALCRSDWSGLRGRSPSPSSLLRACCHLHVAWWLSPSRCSQRCVVWIGQDFKCRVLQFIHLTPGMANDELLCVQ